MFGFKKELNKVLPATLENSNQRQTLPRFILIMSRGRVSTQSNKFSSESEKIFRKNSSEIKACVEILNGIRMAESAAQKSHAMETVNFKGNPFKDQDDNPRTENWDKKKSRYNR